MNVAWNVLNNDAMNHWDTLALVASVLGASGCAEAGAEGEAPAEAESCPTGTERVPVSLTLERTDPERGTDAAIEDYECVGAMPVTASSPTELALALADGVSLVVRVDHPLEGEAPGGASVELPIFEVGRELWVDARWDESAEPSWTCQVDGVASVRLAEAGEVVVAALVKNFSIAPLTTEALGPAATVAASCTHAYADHCVESAVWTYFEVTLAADAPVTLSPSSSASFAWQERPYRAWLGVAKDIALTSEYTCEDGGYGEGLELVLVGSGDGDE